MIRPRSFAALALVVAIASAGVVTAAAQAATCAPGLTADQCKVCALSANPAKCHACIGTAKASKEWGMVAAACMVCGSLGSPAAQDVCSNCVKTQGYASGCSTCAGAALFGIAANTKPTAQGLATAEGCFACHAKAGPDLMVSWLF